MNLWLRWEDYIGNVWLLRPYLPDGTPILTSAEEVQLRKDAQAFAQAEVERRGEAELAAQRAEALAQQEAHRRQQVGLELEQLRAQLAALEDEDS